MTSLELLNADKIRDALNNTTLKQLTALEIFNEIDSTNSYLLNQPQVATGHVCLAEQQSAGRGRRNKYWHSPFAKNIYLSLCWHFTDIKQLAGLSIAVGVAVANVLTQYGVPHIDLKWPNDIWYQRKKLAGVLVEINKAPDNSQRVIIGTGINVDTSEQVDVIDQPWTTVADILQQKPSRNNLVSDLLNELFNTLTIFQAQGLAPFLLQWQRYDVLLNKPVTIHYPHEQLTGIAAGIDSSGNLLVDFNGIIKPVYSGEVSVRF